MRTTLDCLPCYVRQALEAARFTSPDPQVHERVLRQTLRLIEGMDFGQSPPEMGKYIHAFVREATGNPDPYQAVKQRFNQAALQWLPRLEKMVADSDRPLETAVRLAIAGNIIDFGIHGSLEESDLERGIQHALSAPLNGCVTALGEAVRQARNILYLADNTGEIVWDQLLLKQLPLEKVTLAVRGAPIINDATWADAEALGLTAWVKTITTGADVPGVLLPFCSPEFARQFEAADLLLSKGQGNFETLDGVGKNIFFLFKVKCAIVAEKVRLPLGSLVLLNSTTLSRVRAT